MIPLQFVGAADTELTDLSVDEQMKYVLANTQEREGGYAVRHGTHPLSEFGNGGGKYEMPALNPIAAAYPVLFPYGVGGMEADRPQLISFDEQACWALQYHDGQF